MNWIFFSKRQTENIDDHIIVIFNLFKYDDNFSFVPSVNTFRTKSGEKLLTNAFVAKFVLVFCGILETFFPVVQCSRHVRICIQTFKKIVLPFSKDTSTIPSFSRFQKTNSFLSHFRFIEFHSVIVVFPMHYTFYIHWNKFIKVSIFISINVYRKQIIESKIYWNPNQSLIHIAEKSL